MTQVIWRRHARATQVTLRIDASRGKLVVTLPRSAPRAAGRALLARNADWVRQSLAALPTPLCIEDGGTIGLDGLPHRIRLVPGTTVSAAGSVLHVGADGAGAVTRVLGFLRREAEARLPPRAFAKASIAGVSPPRIRLRDTRARWGSCSPDGVIMLSWRLVMAPLFVQDYVLAHEVAHLSHLDHGAAFWALTDRLTPHRAAAGKWLEREGPALLRLGRV